MRSVLFRYSRCATAAVPERVLAFSRCGGKTKSMDVEGVACVIRFDVTRTGQDCQALLFIVQVYRQLAANRRPMFDGSSVWRNSYLGCSTALDQLDKGGVPGSSCMDSFMLRIGCSESSLRIELAHGQWS